MSSGKWQPSCLGLNVLSVNAGGKKQIILHLREDHNEPILLNISISKFSDIISFMS